MNRFANYFVSHYCLKFGLKLDSNKRLVNSYLSKQLMRFSSQTNNNSININSNLKSVSNCDQNVNKNKAKYWIINIIIILIFKSIKKNFKLCNDFFIDFSFY
jgi:hypothetical protein